MPRFGKRRLCCVVAINCVLVVAWRYVTTSNISPPPVTADDNCTCTDPVTMRPYKFCIAPGETTRFNCSSMEYLHKLNLLEETSPITGENMFTAAWWMAKDEHGYHRRIAYVTAISDIFVRQSVRLVDNMLDANPGQKLIVYDMGLSDDNVKLIRSFCSVEYRLFNFEKYPQSVAALKEYRWKPLIVAEVLLEYSAVWWMDSSVVWHANQSNVARATESMLGSMGLISPKRAQKFSWLMFLMADHSIFAATAETTYNYLGSENVEAFKRKRMYGAGFMFIARTPESHALLRWTVLCALETECMGPTGTVMKKCNRKRRWSGYADCHRFDQSVINILLANKNHMNSIAYSAGRRVNFNIARGHYTIEVETLKKLTTCA